MALLLCAACDARPTTPIAELASIDGAPAPSSEVADASPEAAGPERADVVSGAAPREIGPYELPFLPNRSVYLVVPAPGAGPKRLVANLHGLCNPPGYACGYWTRAASEVGFLVCPEGNSSCGPGAYNAPTWTESFEAMSEDLERAVEATSDAYPDESPEWERCSRGEKATCESLAKQGYPARLFVMPKVGHAYSADIDERMREALAFVLAHE